MRIVSQVLLLLCLTIGVCIPREVQAQDEKGDVVVLFNGEKKTGKVVAIGGSSIKFSYVEETLEYELPKKDVNKIIFPSGRAWR